MNFLCPSCRTPLPRAPIEQVTCTGCGVQVDLTRAETAPGQARLWPEVDLSGDTLGGYVLEKLLGTGGMGTVYEARAPDGTKVALKVLAPLLAAEPELRERFRREARALTAITHRGVVKMLAEGEERSFCWYAMELVSGADLRARLKAGPLKNGEVVELARALLEALDAVHAAGFVHRDLKPANVLLAPDGPKLCDFGIARVEDASTLTASAAVMGSLRYMSPEQRWGRSDQRSDLYGLGVVLHEALALGVPGEKPLPASTSRTLTKLIEALTANAPDRRPQSARAALKLLERGRQQGVLIAGIAATAIVLLAAAWATSPLGTSSQEHVEDAGTLSNASNVPAPVAVELDAGDDAGVTDAGVPDAGPDDAGLPDAGLDDEPPPFVAVKPPPIKSFLGKPPPKGKIEKVEKPAERTEPGLPARVTVEGSGGGAKVLVRGIEIGRAPGTFDVEPGGFVLQVVCDALIPGGGKKKSKASHPTFSFKASAKAGVAPNVYRYQCPE